MKFVYVSKEVSVTEPMKDMVEKKLGKFDHYFSSKGELLITITLSVLPNRNLAVEISMTKQSIALRAKVISTDFYVAVDMLVDKLEGQLRKVKAQAKKSAKKPAALKAFKNIDFEQIDDEDMKVSEIVKRKTLDLAPMDVEEALCRMDALGHNFFIYLDSSTDLVNVLYTRDDGSYGVIEIKKH